MGKNKNGVVGLLVLIIIILSVLCVLFATGTISLKGSTIINQDTSVNGTFTDNNIDSALLNSLYDILGINWESTATGDCLNKFLSNNNYKDVNYKDNANDYSSNAKRVFSLYASHNNMTTYRYNDSSCGEKCKQAYSCAECTSILKKEAEKVKKIYGLEDLKFNDLPDIDTDYAYSTGISAGVCHYGVEHDLNSEYIDSNTIKITDKQVVTDYVFGEDTVASTKNQTATYIFKKDTEGNYNLDQVTIN